MSLTLVGEQGDGCGAAVADLSVEPTSSVGPDDVALEQSVRSAHRKEWTNAGGCSRGLEDGVMEPVSVCMPARLSCDVPPAWYVKESLTLIAPDGSASVIMSSEPLDTGIDTEEYVSLQGDLLRTEFPGYRELLCQPVPWPHEYSAWYRRFQWCPPDGNPVEQLQVYWVDRGRAYTGTATAQTDVLGRADETLLSVLQTFHATADRAVAPRPGGRSRWAHQPQPRSWDCSIGRSRGSMLARCWRCSQWILLRPGGQSWP